jgi:hypothetical protein
MEKSKEERDEKLVELAKVQGDFEAQVLRAMLESEGLEVAVGTGVTPSILPFTVDGLGQVKLYVKESDLEAARAVMRENEEAKRDALNGEPGDAEDEPGSDDPDDAGR